MNQDLFGKWMNKATKCTPYLFELLQCEGSSKSKPDCQVITIIEYYNLVSRYYFVFISICSREKNH